MLDLEHTNFEDESQYLQHLYKECADDPANLNTLYTLVGRLTLIVSTLLADRLKHPTK